MSKRLVTRIQNKYDYESNWNKATFIPLDGELIIYGSEVDETGNVLSNVTIPEGRDALNYSRIKVGDGKRTLTELPFVGGKYAPPTVKEKVPVPVQSETLTYNGNTQYPSWTYNTDLIEKVTQESIENAIDSGSYNYTFKIKNPSKYEFDVNTENKSRCVVQWTINKAEGLYIDFYDEDNKSFTFNINDLGNEKEIRLKHSPIQINSDTEYITYLSANGLDTNYLDYNWELLTETTSKFTLKCLDYYAAELEDPEGTEFTFTIGVHSPNYVEETIYIEDVKINYNLPKRELDKNSWDVISETSRSGYAKNLWNIGDVKEIKLNGKINDIYEVNSITYNDNDNNITRYAYIIELTYDPDNSQNNGITFGCFKMKNSSEEYIDAALIDEPYYNNEHLNRRTLFEYMGTNASNFGCGWRTSNIRKVLGSGAFKDNESENYPEMSYPDTELYAETNGFLPNSLVSCFPEELRKKLFPMTKFTSKDSNNNISVDETTEYLPLLSLAEIIGDDATMSSSVENLHQTQYTYFKNGNSSIKYKDTVVNTPCVYWTRSPYKSMNDRACYINVEGKQEYKYAGTSIGIAPIFRI